MEDLDTASRMTTLDVTLGDCEQVLIAEEGSKEAVEAHNEVKLLQVSQSSV